MAQGSTAGPPHRARWGVGLPATHGDDNGRRLAVAADNLVAVALHMVEQAAQLRPRLGYRPDPKSHRVLLNLVHPRLAPLDGASLDAA
jgi:hypothetical protein